MLQKVASTLRNQLFLAFRQKSLIPENELVALRDALVFGVAWAPGSEKCVSLEPCDMTPYFFEIEGSP